MKINNPKRKWFPGFVACLFTVSLSPGVMAGSTTHSTFPTDVTVQSGVLLAAKDTDAPQKEVPTYHKLLKQAMDQFFAVVESIANDKTLTLLQQQQKVKQLIQVVRWGPEKKDTFFAFDTQGKMLASVYQPDLVEKDMSSWEDPMGNKPFAEMLRLIREKGEGFVNYNWPSYEGKFYVPHVAYVRLMRQWDWGFGTHVAIEDIEGYEMPEVVLYILERLPPLPRPRPRPRDVSPIE